MKTAINTDSILKAESIHQISAMDLMLNNLIYQRQFIVFKIRQIP